jgi:hypothetical protein
VCAAMKVRTPCELRMGRASLSGAAGHEWPRLGGRSSAASVRKQWEVCFMLICVCGLADAMHRPQQVAVTGAGGRTGGLVVKKLLEGGADKFVAVPIVRSQKVGWLIPDQLHALWVDLEFCPLKSVAAAATAPSAGSAHPATASVPLNCAERGQGRVYLQLGQGISQGAGHLQR